eukprot:TRINITY_DN11907_c0_g1_i1.p2 TRINITY_DN11907_c0_g1~~TRINITY_DN11907_c0_g1_i1.p2  ORF type:complete len:101 (+),score=24.81 TRINITY_DN11907_c0_g1_i1:105-407(+)
MIRRPPRSTLSSSSAASDVYKRQINKIGYQAQVIPAMLAGFVLAYLEIWLRKWIPQYISMIVVPLLALVPTVIIAHTVLCLLYTSPSPRDRQKSRMPSSA